MAFLSFNHNTQSSELETKQKASSSQQIKIVSEQDEDEYIASTYNDISTSLNKSRNLNKLADIRTRKMSPIKNGMSNKFFIIQMILI
jgi:hypothetical protein